MASNVVITVPPDLRRATVKTTPAMSLKDIVVHACDQLKLGSPDLYDLRRANARPGSPQDRPLDLSLSVRLANLSAGAKLELIRRARPASSAGPMKIALQLDSGGRIIDTFPGTTRLWDVLTITEQKSGGTLNLTRREGHPKEGSKSLFGQLSAKLGEPDYMIPVMIVANREIASLNELRNSTLASLGIPAGGSVLIRLVFKFSGRKLADVLPEIEAPLPPVEGLTQVAVPRDATPPPPPAPAVVPAADTAESAHTAVTVAPSSQPPVNNQAAAIPANEQQPTASDDRERLPSQGMVEDRMEIDPPVHSTVGAPAAMPMDQQQPSEADIEQHPDPVMDRSPTLFAPPTASSLTKIEIPDSFFQLTGAELKAVFSAQERRRRELENTPLKTQAMRDREDRQRRAKFPRTLVRVKLPDEFILQLTFYTHEKVSTLYSTLASLLVTTPPPLSFRLVTTAPRTKDLDPSDDFWTAQLAPASVVRLIPLAHDVWPHSSPDMFHKDQVGPVVPLPEAGDGQSHNLLLESVPAQETHEEKRDRLAKVSRDLAARVLGGRTLGESSGASSSSLDGSAGGGSASHGAESKTPKWFRPIKK